MWSTDQRGTCPFGSPIEWAVRKLFVKRQRPKAVVEPSHHAGAASSGESELRQRKQERPEPPALLRFGPGLEGGLKVGSRNRGMEGKSGSHRQREVETAGQPRPTAHDEPSLTFANPLKPSSRAGTLSYAAHPVTLGGPREAQQASGGGRWEPIGSRQKADLHFSAGRLRFSTGPPSCGARIPRRHSHGAFRAKASSHVSGAKGSMSSSRRSCGTGQVDARAHSLTCPTSESPVLSRSRNWR